MEKYSLLVIAFTIVFASCKSKAENDAVQTANEIQATVKQNTPGTVPTTSEGFMMKAKINGKDWEATAMMPPERPSRIIGYDNNDYISFPYDRRDMVVGEKTKLGENHAGVDVFMMDNIWGAKKGEMEITKVDEKSAEGKFSFTATGLDSDKTLEVTDGFFRILFK
ncbi:hypothetical protein [Flavisolibacter ginsenosidimutans]|uniref:Uncharacterized protein n=1 Tax=Flavisolibacter ginsenosidimutans TaxID=661481 RepID=A0A5B8UDD3_9BACT|nr:hypothetical protein [Flavisolibacter ginsenosidimutans]QEC54574.1 hypothetical protein FSB75_01220 [Flavisolibacter ginsenosidimutans]